MVNPVDTARNACSTRVHAVNLNLKTITDMQTTYIGPMPIRADHTSYDPAWGAAYQSWLTRANAVSGLVVRATDANHVTRSSGLILHDIANPRRITKAQLAEAWALLADQSPLEISIMHDKGITTYDGQTMTVYEDGLPVFESGPAGTCTDRAALADCI